MEMEYKDEDELFYVCARESNMVERKVKPIDYDTFKSKLDLSANDISIEVELEEDGIESEDTLKTYDIKEIISKISFNNNIKLAFIEYLNLKCDLDDRNNLFDKLINYIKLSITREMILDNLLSIKNEKIIENKLNYYKKYEDIINDINMLGFNINNNNDLYDLIKEYEVQLQYVVTEFDLVYSLFNLITNEENNDTIISDLEKVRLNTSLRKGKNPRTEYEFIIKFEELKKKLRLYFKLENNINSNEINKDLNRYLVLRELKGIEMLYLNSYKVKPSIEMYKNFISNIDSKYYDFFLREDIMKHIIQNADMGNLNKLMNEIIHISKRKFKKILYGNTNIYQKVDIINKLNTYNLGELELEGMHNILESIVNEDEITLEEIKKIKNYIIK